MYFGDFYSRFICGKFTVRWQDQPDAPALATDKTEFKQLLSLLHLEITQMLLVNGELLIYVAKE